MSDFEYDCLQKKRLARQAQYKKNGSKSKKCTLPHEYLTEKQLRERNGVMTTYNLSKPMDWKTFKSMPVELQKEYIAKLIEKHGVNVVGLLELFDINRSTLMRHMQVSGMNFTFSKGHRMSKEQKDSWDEFCHGSDSVAEVVGEEHVEPLPEPNKRDSEPEAKRIQTPKMTMEKLCLNFNGNLDTAMIANSLKMILGDGWCGDVEIMCHAACAEA